MKQPCEVCGVEPSVGVCSSVLGGFSHAIGKRCLFFNAENYGMVKATLELCDGWKHTADWVRDLTVFIGQYVYADEAIKDEDLDPSWIEEMAKAD